MDYAHQWFNSLGAPYDAPLQAPACPTLEEPSPNINYNSWMEMDETRARDEEIAILDPKIQWIDENLDSILQASQARMPHEESDIFAVSIVKLVTNLKQKCMHGLRMQEGEARALETFIISAQALLNCTPPWPEHQSPIIEPQVPWPASDDPSLYIYCKNQSWEQGKDAWDEQDVDDSTAYLLENAPPWPAIDDPIFTTPWPPADDPSLSSIMMPSNDNEEEFKRELLHYAMEEEDTSIFPHGDERASPQLLWECSNNVGVDEDSPTCLVEEEHPPINDLAPPTQEEQPPCTSYHMDFTTEPFPPYQHPSQLEEGATVESLGIHIEMVMPYYIKDQKQA